MHVLREFLSPNFFSRDVELTTIEIAFPIPCGSAPNAEPITSGPRLVTSVPCADPRRNSRSKALTWSPMLKSSSAGSFPTNG